MGTGGLVPHRSPSRSPNVPPKPPSNKASHRRAEGRCGQLRSSQAGPGRSSGGGEEDPSEPLPAQRWGRLVSADHREVCGTQRRRRRADTRAALDRTSARTRALPRPPPQPGASPGDTPTTQAPDASRPAAQAALLARPFSPLTWNPTPGSAGPVMRPRASAQGRELRVPESRGRPRPLPAPVAGLRRELRRRVRCGSPRSGLRNSQLVPSGYPHMWHCF